MADEEIYEVEGDPNRRHRAYFYNGTEPQLAWVRTDALVVGDRVLLGKQYIHTVIESIPQEGDLWKLSLANPEVASRTARIRSGKLSGSFPRERRLIVDRSSPYRKIVG